MAKFRAFSEYNLTLTKRSDGQHNLQAESNDGSHNIEIVLTPEQALELLSKGGVQAKCRVNGKVDVG
jgi:hypothetical protein